MNETDNPLKRVVEMSITDFAEWILGKKVARVETANIELQADPTPIFADQLFWVTLAESEEDGIAADVKILFHIEFQAKSSHKPMWLRVLDYDVRFVNRERNARIHNVVFYIGDGTGARDTGHHEVKGIGNRLTLSWHYDVVHLWKESARDLLELKRPGLLPLIGQMKIENPDELIPQVYDQIKAVPNEETRHRLFTELLALLRDEEVITMVETLMEKDEWVLDTPYIRRWREKGREQGREEGREQGREENKVEVVRNALLLSMPLQSIAAITSMKLADIMRIQEELGLAQS